MTAAMTWADLKRQMDKARDELAAMPQWQREAIRAEVASRFEGRTQ